MTIIEMMIGLAVGLFVVLAGAVMLATFTDADRRMLLETRLLQDLRAASDVITRDIRRAGYWANASTGVWVGPGAPPQNPYQNFLAASCDASAPVAPNSATSSTEGVCYYVAQDTDNVASPIERFGFKLDGGVIYAVVAGAGATAPTEANALTDAKTITVSDFVITPSSQTIDARVFCIKPCTTNCPRVVVREFEVLIKGNVPGDTTIARSLRSDVRVRNDYLDGQCPT
jgi:type IV pilus assembly protein PilW